MQQKLNISKSSVRDLLSFIRLDKKILEKIHNKHNLAANLAYEITRLQDKGPKYIAALIDLAPKISTGKIGVRKLHKLIHEIIDFQSSRVEKATEIRSSEGRHIFTWRGDTNGQRSIAFPKDIRESINFSEVENLLKQNIEEQLNRLKNKS